MDCLVKQIVSSSAHKKEFGYELLKNRNIYFYNNFSIFLLALSIT